MAISFVFCFTNTAILHAQTCSPVGAKQEKYTANLTGCDYTTDIRECCADSNQSAWGGSCDGKCPSEQCWNGSGCDNKPVRECKGNIANAVSGTQTRNVTCHSGYGWTPVEGGAEWSGSCNCKGGYVWNSSNNNCKACRVRTGDEGVSNNQPKPGATSDYIYDTREKALAACNAIYESRKSSLFYYTGFKEGVLDVSECPNANSTIEVKPCTVLEKHSEVTDSWGVSLGWEYKYAYSFDFIFHTCDCWS